jgi:hypothetical protein
MTRGNPFGLWVALALATGGCGDDDATPKAAGSGGHGGEARDGGNLDTGAGGRGTAGDADPGGGDAAPADAASHDASASDTLCAKYGGAENVMSVMRNQVISEIAGDCRVNAFFAVLHPTILDHVGQCLGIMAQELFGCPGIVYAGSASSAGRECRDMTESHRGLKISQGDFDALLEDVVAGLAAAGVEQVDIAAAAPALLGMRDEIVESAATTTTQEFCESGAHHGEDAASEAGLAQDAQRDGAEMSVEAGDAGDAG